MHPDSPYGMYMEDLIDPIPICLDISGYSGFLATKLLGEVWEDEYTGYCYEEGDESYVELYMLIDDLDGREDYDIFVDEDEDAE